MQEDQPMLIDKLGRMLLCGAVLMAWGGWSAWAADTPDLKAQAEAGLKTLAAAESTVYASRGHFAGGDELAEMYDANLNADIAGMLQAKPDTGVYYNVAASRDGQRFFAVAYYGRDFATLIMDETGAISSTPTATSAQRLIEQQQLAAFFAAKPQWAGEAEAMVKQQMHQVQLAVERWSTDHSDKGENVYPETLEPVVTEGYIPAGFYPNPVSAWSVEELNAQVVPLGQWSPGDFSYVPHIVDGRCTGYMLAGYGCRRAGGHDYNGDGAGDGYIIMLSSGADDGGWHTQVLEQLQ
jgi:hypothetical protein